MKRHTLGLLLGLCLAAPTFADDLPYYQQQRVVVIFSIAEAIEAKTFDGSAVRVLDPGYYRFDGTQKSRYALNAESFADETGPFTKYGGSVQGQIKPLLGGAAVRDMTVRLELSDASFDYENVVRAGELEFSLRVQLSAMSSTQLRYSGDVARTGPFVPGSLSSVYTAQTGTIAVHHVKLALDDSQLPIRAPLESFPQQLQARVRPTPAEEDGFEIEAGPYDFTLTRDALNAVGAVGYDSAAHFPMVEESDYYGDYVSSPFDAQLVLQADGNVHLRLGWSLGGRYHGWSHSYTAIMTRAEYETLLRDGALTVTGSADFHWGGEDGTWDISTPMQLELTTTPATAPAAGMTSALPN